MAGAPRFVGTWRLVAWEVREPDGTVRYPLGTDATGQLIYTPGGHMSVHVMRAGRPPFASGDFLDGTPEEIAAAFHGYLAYCGTYEVREAEGTIVHHPACSLLPNWIGVPQTRLFELADNRLILRSPPLPVAGSERTVVIIWERIE